MNCCCRGLRNQHSLLSIGGMATPSVCEKVLKSAGYVLLHTKYKYQHIVTLVRRTEQDDDVMPVTLSATADTEGHAVIAAYNTLLDNLNKKQFTLNVYLSELQTP